MFHQKLKFIAGHTNILQTLLAALIAEPAFSRFSLTTDFQEKQNTITGSGKAKEKKISPVMYVLAVLFILKYIIL